MKLHQAHYKKRNLFTGYGPGFFLINQQQYNSNLIVTPDHIVLWDVTTFDELTPEHFASLQAISTDVIIFGTGKTLRFPHPRLTAAVSCAQIGIEVMDTHAACRTYNILLAEDRRVLAALLTC